MSAPEPLLRLPKVPTGLYGEIVVADALASLGFTVDMRGGGVKWSDGTADRDSIHLDIQVKCTSKASGAIHWAKPGADARFYADVAMAAGRVAVFIFAHASNVERATMVDGEIRLPRPAINLFATTAREYADDVDAARTQYGQETYRRGALKGQVKPESGLSFPVYADEYLTLTEFWAWVTDHATSGLSREFGNPTRHGPLSRTARPRRTPRCRR